MLGRYHKKGEKKTWGEIIYPSKHTKEKPQIWFGTEADSFSYDFVWHLPMQMCLDGDILSFKREGNIPIFLNSSDCE